jgi:hypothetical protein
MATRQRVFCATDQAVEPVVTSRGGTHNGDERTGGYMRRIALLVVVLALGVSCCESSEETTPEEVWTDFIEAVNAGDVETVEALFAPQIEWTWDSDLLAIHRSASGRKEAVTGIEDLLGRGVTFDSTVVKVVGTTLTCESVFHEPGLADFLGGHTLLQTDVVTVSDGAIVSWASTADETVPVEE